MARIRTIKPDFFQNEQMASCSAHAQLLAIGLLPQCDDEGYFEAHPKLIKARVFPFSEDSLNIHELLTELALIGYLQLHEDSSKKQYGYIPGFLRHQKVNRPTPSKIKEVLDNQGKLIESSVSDHVGLTLGKEGKGKEGKGKEGKGKEGSETSASTTPASPPPPFSITQLHRDIARSKNLDLESELKAYIEKVPHHNQFGFVDWLKYAKAQAAKPVPISDDQKSLKALYVNLSVLQGEKAHSEKYGTQFLRKSEYEQVLENIKILKSKLEQQVSA